MKTRLLTVLLFFIAISTQLQARPSLGGLEQQLGILMNTLVVCPPNSPVRFVDNGDNTICDHETGLMWEKKRASDSVQNLVDPIDPDNNYTWSLASNAPDGTAFTDFLARMNGEAADGGNGPNTFYPAQIGGHRDWRLPTIVELQTIMDCSFGSPCIDPIFGPTAAYIYWSSTYNTVNSGAAWLVNFNNGIVGFNGKGNSFRVRAVRGSSRVGPEINTAPGPIMPGPVVPVGPIVPL